MNVILWPEDRGLIRVQAENKTGLVVELYSRFRMAPDGMERPASVPGGLIS